MNRQIPILAGLCCVIAVATVLVSGQTGITAKSNLVGNTSFNGISKEEIEMLLTDVGKTNPKVLEHLAADPEMRKLQIESLKQLLALASQAQRDGIASNPTNRQELDNIRAEVLAVNYDREVNKGKSDLPAFGYITEGQVAGYWAEDGRAGTGGKPTHEAEFGDFLSAKIEILRASDPTMKDREASKDEIAQARAVFAKTRIYKSEFDQNVRAGKLPKLFIAKANLQVKLQQAQFLARLYSQKIVDQAKVTHDEISKYIAEHPEFDTASKKAKAEQILKRARAGEDFAALANEFSEDPGNKGANGEPLGGIYTDVPVGRMVPPFEQAALALEPGQVAPNVVESDFGYHIIKLEKKGAVKDPAGHPTQIYDVRHILIATTYKDPSDENGPDMPVKDYVRNMLETDREKQLIDKIVAESNIQVPEDFTVPGAVAPQPPKTVKKAPVTKKRPVKTRRR
jgi:parvulin-like peptidyl-prolyl isomerase